MRQHAARFSPSFATCGHGPRGAHRRAAAVRKACLCARKLAAAALVLALSWWSAARPAQAAVKVVTTLPSLAAIAKAVGGAQVDVLAMATATQDAHFVDARPSHIVALSRADLVLANGLELEVGWLPNLQVASRNAAVQVGGQGYLEVAQFVDLLEVPQVRIDRAMGDLHTGGNPHFLNEPGRVGQIARGVGQRLAQLDPDHAADYVRRADAFAKRQLAVRARWRDALATVPPERRHVVAYHKSLAYLLDWLGLSEAAVLEPRPGVPPDPGHVAQVLKTMRQRQVAALVQEEYYPTRVGETLRKLGKVPLVVLPANVRFAEGQTYEAYFDVIGQKIAEALGAGQAAKAK